MTAPWTTPEEQIMGRHEWRLMLMRDYEYTSDRLRRAYSSVSRELWRDFGPLARHMQSMYDAQDGRLSPEDVRGMPQYSRLLARINAEMTGFNNIVHDETGALVDRSKTYGVEAARHAALENAGPGRVWVAREWVQPNPEALDAMRNIVDSSAFDARWKRFGEWAAEDFGSLLMTGIAQGKNPRFMARLAKQWLNLPLASAENAARTAQMYSYRRGNQITFLSNAAIVQGWYWSSARDPRTCISCWEQDDGVLRPLTEELNDHHQGRCSMSPHVRGFSQSPGSAREAFEQMPEEMQIKVMGRSIHQAWKKGDVKWGEFSGTYNDPVYGVMRRAKSARELGILTRGAPEPVAPRRDPNRASYWNDFYPRYAKARDASEKVMTDPLDKLDVDNNLGAREELKEQVMRRIADRLRDDPLWRAEVDEFYRSTYDIYHKPGDSRSYRFGGSVDEETVARLVQQWAHSSADTRPLSVAMQLAAKEEFGFGTLAHLDAKTVQQARDEFGKYIDNGFLGKFLRAQYDMTQDYLKQNGVEELWMWRGFDVSARVFGQENFGSMKDAGLRFFEQEFAFQPISSFSTKYDQARRFHDANTYDDSADVGVMLGGFVPAEDVMSCPFFGNGCSNEYEMVVLGRNSDFWAMLPGSRYSFSKEDEDWYGPSAFMGHLEETWYD